MQITDKDTSTLGLLFNETPLLIRKELAVRIGLNEAIVLQQVHFHIQNKYKSVKEKDRQDDRAWREGTFWTYNSYKEWREADFPFWSVSTIERTFKKLEKQEILRSGNFNKMKTDQTKWYTINYEKLLAETEPKKAENVGVEQSVNLMESAVDQSVNLTNCVVEQSVNMTDSNPSICCDPIRQFDVMLPKRSLEVSKDSSSSSSVRNQIDSKLREKYSDRPFDEIKSALLADETAIIDTERQYAKLLEYRLKNYIAKKQFTAPRKQSSKKAPIRTEKLPAWFDEAPEYQSKQTVSTQPTQPTQPTMAPEEADAMNREIDAMLAQLDMDSKKKSIEDKLKQFRNS